MKKVYLKKTYKDLHLIASVIRCKKCKKENLYSSLSSYAGEWDAAVECGNCGAMIVFDIWEIPEFRNVASGKPHDNILTEQDIIKWRHQQLKKFYDSMPECPNCKCHLFNNARLGINYPIEGFVCKKCENDLTKMENSKVIGISYYKYSMLDAWWYEVVNDDKPETPDNH